MVVGHKKFKHEGIKYECDQCDYKAAQPGKLKYHQQRKQDGVKYSCPHCGQWFTTPHTVENISNLSLRVFANIAICMGIR